jgi:hypothetical protein
MAHALNRICKDILTKLKSGSIEEARDGQIDRIKAGLVAKLRHIAMWIGKSTQRLK